MTPPESCLSIPHINFSYDPKLIAHSWLLSLGKLEWIWRLWHAELPQSGFWTRGKPSGIEDLCHEALKLKAYPESSSH